MVRGDLKAAPVCYKKICVEHLMEYGGFAMSDAKQAFHIAVPLLSSKSAWTRLTLSYLKNLMVTMKRSKRRTIYMIV